MTGPQAAAALLLLLPLYASEGAHFPLSSPGKHVVQGNRRVGRVLRGQPENADAVASRSLLGATSASGHLALLDKCYMTDDCAPGLFMVRLTTPQRIAFFSIVYTGLSGGTSHHIQ